MASKAAHIAGAGNGLFADINERLVLDPTSETHLRWTEHVNSPRAKPGGQAGSYQTAVGHWVVGVAIFSIYCRHVVWMLQHQQLLPNDSEVIHIDGDRNNLAPSNLKLVPISDIYTGKAVVCTRASSKRSTFPKSFRLTPRPFGLYNVEFNIGKTWEVFAVARNREVAVAQVAVAMKGFGMIKNVAKAAAVLHPGESAGIEATVACAWSPRVLTAEEQRNVQEMARMLLALYSALQNEKATNEMLGRLPEPAKKQTREILKMRDALPQDPLEALPGHTRKPGRPKQVEQVQMPYVPPKADEAPSDAIDAGLATLFGGVL